MASIYDETKTAKDLVNKVMLQGMSTKQEDIVRMQDIFGNSTIEELAALANDIGRNNENGEPDPKGTWSSNRKATQSTFYMIAFSIWNWEDATRFWNTHTNPVHGEVESLKEKSRILEKRVKELEERRNGLLKEELEAAEKIGKLYDDLAEAEKRAEAAERTTIELKAKIYDLTIGKE